MTATFFLALPFKEVFKHCLLIRRKNTFFSICVKGKGSVFFNDFDLKESENLERKLS